MALANLMTNAGGLGGVNGLNFNIGLNQMQTQNSIDHSLPD